jgi:hypothetical protein
MNSRAPYPAAPVRLSASRVLYERTVLHGRVHGARHHPLPAAPPRAWGLPVPAEDSTESNE